MSVTGQSLIDLAAQRLIEYHPDMLYNVIYQSISELTNRLNWNEDRKEKLYRSLEEAFKALLYVFEQLSVLKARANSSRA